MTVDDRNNVDLIKEAWGAFEYDEGTGWDWVSRLAEALEDAVMRIAELEDERDDALAHIADLEAALIAQHLPRDAIAICLCLDETCDVAPGGRSCENRKVVKS